MNDKSARYMVSTEWLEHHLDSPDITIIDASWHLPTVGRDARAEYLEERIPGAVFFDIDDICDETSPLPHMLPSAVKFSSRMRSMGIGDGTRIVAYDATGLSSAARAWWMFRTFGHDDVVVLDGGFPKWRAEGRPIDDDPPGPRQERHFSARHQMLMVRDRDDVLDAVKTGREQIADARPPARFSGEADEPRPGLRSGHMPGACNVFYGSLLNDDATIKSANEIKTAFETAGIDLERPVITTCGSGVTAAVLSLGLAIIGHDDNALYDGSWSEWGGDDALPVETG